VKEQTRGLAEEASGMIGAPTEELEQDKMETGVEEGEWDN